MARFISTDLIKRIADHHDAHPSDYKEFVRVDGPVLVTREGGLVKNVRSEVLRLKHRIEHVATTLEVTGINEAKLVIGDGTYYVIVYMK